MSRTVRRVGTLNLGIVSLPVVSACAAGGRLFLATQDGGLLCFAGR